MSIEDWTDVATKAIALYEEAGQQYAELASRELDLEAGRTEQKCDAILRIKSGEDRLNPDKSHSVSSAEKQVELDPIYRKYLAQQSETVFQKNRRYYLMQSARLRCELAIALIKNEAGVA